MTSVRELHDSAEVRSIVHKVDSAQLAREIGASKGRDATRTEIARLRVAAIAALADALGDESVDSLLRTFAAADNATDADERAVMCFRKWCAYLIALDAGEELPDSDDLLMFAAAGLLARQPTEVRSVLRESYAREAVSRLGKQASDLDWTHRVRADATVALLFLVRQENHADVQQSGRVLNRLAEEQAGMEASWLRNDRSSHDALALMGLYLAAEAIVRLAEFLLSGNVSKDGKDIGDVAPELRRLLIQADELLTTAGSLDDQFWLKTVTVLVWRIREDSIWIAGRGISERHDSLLREISALGRERPIFSF